MIPSGGPTTSRKISATTISSGAPMDPMAASAPRARARVNPRAVAGIAIRTSSPCAFLEAAPSPPALPPAAP